MTTNQTINGVPREPFAWYTEDYLTDKSATTYDLATMERWKAKGWLVKPLYIEQPAPAAVDAVIHGSKLDEYDAVLDALDPESVCPYLSNGEVAELVAAVRTLQVRQITQPAPVAVRMCDCNQGRMPCNGKCAPTI